MEREVFKVDAETSLSDRLAYTRRRMGRLVTWGRPGMADVLVVCGVTAAVDLLYNRLAGRTVVDLPTLKKTIRAELTRITKEVIEEQKRIDGLLDHPPEYHI